jgi:aminoglycoside 3-N-acetyltransferase
MGVAELASGLARRYLSGERFDALRGVYLGGRQRMAPVIRLVRGTFDAPTLRRHLHDRIGQGFQILMVHSSMNGMQPTFTGTPLELVKMLVEFVGPERTLAMPAFYFGEGGLGAYPTFAARPRFDLTRTASQMGLATELFRRLPGVVQSRHPAYRVAAIGPLAAELTRGHEEADTPAGRGTPFEFMAQHDTCILGIGKHVEVMTQAHHIEHLLGDAFPVPSRPTPPLAMTLVERGREIPFQLRSREIDGRFDPRRIRRLLKPGTLAEWRFHGVPLFAARAADATRDLVEAARRGQTLYEPLA